VNNERASKLWGMDVCYDMDKKFIETAMYATGSTSAAVADWGKKADEFHFEKMTVLGSCPEGSVAHNATLGGSLWQSDPSQDLEYFVGDLRFGASLGIDKIFASQSNFRVAYSAVMRSDEFEGQKKPVDYGSILLSVTRKF
jgi:hypothetical protein